MRPSAERSIMIAVICFILTIIISFAMSEGWIKQGFNDGLRKEEKSATAILLDIKGPKIRTHNFKNGEAVFYMQDH